MATISTTAFSRKMRQNRGTRFRLLAIGTLKAPTARGRGRGAGRHRPASAPARGGAIGDSPHFPGVGGPGATVPCVPVPRGVGGRDGWFRPCAPGDPGGTVPGG
ncbi:hypothetical protein GCM10018771_10910 [Streptomyces cellulosae]|nr:hypothetical protein GCM10018771_10910 [Streptomyces cellulosae]